MSVLTPPRKLAVNLRIAIIQLNPRIGQINQNLTRARNLVDKLKESISGSPAKAPDLVVFPEFALTGYNFHSRDHILPYATRPNEGPAFKMAKEVSAMFNCYTVIGYPERLDSSPETILYNSAAVTDPKGQLIFNYRKSFMYYTDDDWGCHENPLGFQSFPLHLKRKARDISLENSNDLEDITLKTSIGICMDLSPYKFTAPFHDFEFATYNLDCGNELIICPMAWIHSVSVTKDSGPLAQTMMKDIKLATEKQGIPIYGSQGQYQFDLSNDNPTTPISRDSPALNTAYSDLEQPDMSNVNYWVLRFLPFLSLKQREDWLPRYLKPLLASKSHLGGSYMGATADETWKFKGKNAVVAMANRCGIEDGTTVYAGSSGIFKFNGKADDEFVEVDSTNGSVELLGNLGKGLEGVIMRDVEFEVLR